MAQHRARRQDALVLGQHQEHGQDDLALHGQLAVGQVHMLAFARCDLRQDDLAGLDGLHVTLHGPAQAVAGQGREDLAVPHGHAGLADLEEHIAELVADFLALAGEGAVAQDDAVGVELPVGGLIAEVAAVGQTLLAIGALHAQGLVHIVPDEAALVHGVLVFQLGVLIHAAAGVAHGVGVFAVDEGALGIVLEVLLDVRSLHVHVGKHIGGMQVALVMHAALVMHQAGGVGLAEVLGQVVEVAAAPALVAAGPHEDAGVVLVPLQHGTAAVDGHFMPFGLVAGHDPVMHGRPGAVGLDIGFVDDVQAVLVAQAVELRRVGVVAGTHGVDVHGLHVADVAQHQLAGHHAAAVAVKLMAVHAVEDDALAVQAHDLVDHLELAEAHHRAADLGHAAHIVGQGDGQLIEVGFLGAPELRAGDDALKEQLILAGDELGLLVEHHAGLIRQRHAGLACTAGHGQLRFQMGGGVVLRQGRADAQICQMGLGPEVQCHAAVNAGEAPEVLILQPGAGAALEHPQHQAVLAHAGMTGQVEGVGGHGVLRIADLMAVEVHQHRRFHRAQVQDNAMLQILQAQVEGLDAGDGGVVLFGHLGGLQVLVAVPGILGIDVVGRIPLGVFQLELAGDVDLLQAAVHDGAGQQCIGRAGGIHGEMGLPLAVQAADEGGPVLRHFLGVGEKLVVGGDGLLVDAEDFRVGQPGGGKAVRTDVAHGGQSPLNLFG